MSAQILSVSGLHCVRIRFNQKYSASDHFVSATPEGPNYLGLEAGFGGQETRPEATIFTFIADDAGYFLNLREVRKDGKTAYERTKWEAVTVLGVEFGESCCGIGRRPRRLTRSTRSGSARSS